MIDSKEPGNLVCNIALVRKSVQSSAFIFLFDSNC